MIITGYNLSPRGFCRKTSILYQIRVFIASSYSL
uniref:Uncharacterized protein n=1 Tax=Arundo donax TaxID=35708 RepID=A0A0A9BQT7_ARUDO